MDKKLFLSDEPIEELSQDAFGHKAFVDTLYKCVIDSDTGINIGLFGKWGVGKTSIIKLFIKKINKANQNIKTFLFDAWKYSQLSLCHELVLGLNKEFKVFDQSRLEREIYCVQEEETPVIEKDWASRLGKLLRRFSVSISVTLSLLTLFILLWYFKFISPDIYNKLLFFVLLPIIVDLVIKMNKVVSGTSVVSVPPAKFDPRRIEDIFEKIVNKVTKSKKERKLVVIIDNLDRCSNENAIAMLEAIKTLMEHKKCIYIISCNEDALVQSLESFKGYNPSDAAEFLRKFFQTSLTIPPLLAQDLEKFANDLLSSLEIKYSKQVLQVIVNAFLEEPRKIKQFLNNLTIQYIAAQERERVGIFESGEITGEDGFLAKILIIRQECPLFYEELEYREDILEEIETYFRGTGEVPLYRNIKKGQSDRKDVFADNPRLEQFLKSTRLITVEDVSPFLKLNRETFPSTIPNAQEFKLQVNRGNVQYVSDNLDKLKQEEEIVEYIREISKLINAKIKAGHYDWAFNGVDILTRVYQRIPTSIKQEIAANIGHYMTLREIRSNLDKFDYGVIFPILQDMKKKDSNDILYVYTALLSPERIDIGLIEQFIKYCNLMPEKAVDNLNQKLVTAYRSKREETQVVIRRINEDHEASSKLISHKLVTEIDDSIETSTTTKNKQAVGLYLELKLHLPIKTKASFLQKVLNIIATNRDSVYDETKQFGLQTLLKLDSTDIPNSEVGGLYNTLSEFTGLIGQPNQKLLFIKAFFNFFDIFSKEQRQDFLKHHLVPLINSGDTSILNNILEVTTAHDVKILAYDFVLDSFTTRVRTNLPNLGLIQSITRSTPKEDKEKVKDMMIALINQPQPPFHNTGLESFKQLYDEFRISQIGEICDTCLQRSTSAPGPEKEKFIQPILEAFEKCPAQFKRKFADFTSDFITDDDIIIRHMGIDCFNRIKALIEEDKKQAIIIHLLQAVEQKANQNEIDEDSKSLLDLTITEQAMLESNDKVRLIDTLLALRNEAKEKEIRLIGLEYLGRVDKLHHRKNLVIRTLQADLESEDKEIREQARQTLGALKALPTPRHP